MQPLTIGIVDIFDPVPNKLEDAEYVRIGYLASELIKRGHNIVWWTSDYSHFEKRFRGNPDIQDLSPNWRVFGVKGVAYHKHVSLSRIAHHVVCGRWVARSLEEFMRGSRLDIVHLSNIPLDVSGRVCRLLSRKKVPFNLDFRDNWPDSFTSKVPMLARPIVGAYVEKLVDRLKTKYWMAESFTAVSETYLDWALKRFCPNPYCRSGVFPLAQGVWVKRYREGELQLRSVFRNKVGALESSIVFTFAGSIGKSYQPEIMATLPAVAANMGYDVRVVIVGDGDRLSDVRQIVGGRAGVSFTGWVTKEEVKGYLAASDVCVMAYSPTATQSLPNKIFDYMAAGRPQISSLGGEAEHLLNRGKIGATYKAGDEAEFVKSAMKYITNSALRKEHGANAARLFDRQYTADRVYSDFAGFLEKGATRNDKPSDHIMVESGAAPRIQL